MLKTHMVLMRNSDKKRKADKVKHPVRFIRYKPPFSMAVLHAAAQCPAANRKPDYMPYLFLKRSTRPPVSTSFCLPVKKGWHFEHMSTLRFSLVEPVSNVSPHAQRTVHCVYFGWMFSFICITSSKQSNYIISHYPAKSTANFQFFQANMHQTAKTFVLACRLCLQKMLFA
jgi:hypothetical protein